MSKKKVLIVMARPPQLGKVKTRLAAEIGEEKTLRIYEILLQKVSVILNQVDAEVALFWTNPPFPSGFESYFNHIQSAGELGEKMHSAFSTLENTTEKSMVMIGTDCYDLSAERIQSAFDALNLADVVIGPALDGGYYLIGMNSIHNSLFASMPWSTPHLLSSTIKSMREERLSFILLPSLRDIDEVTDVMVTEDLRAYLN
jgi:uncharacterized protein